MDKCSQEKEPGFSSQQTMSLPEALKPQTRQEGWGTGPLVKLPKILCLWRQREEELSTKQSSWTHIYQLVMALTHFREIS